MDNIKLILFIMWVVICLLGFIVAIIIDAHTFKILEEGLKNINDLVEKLTDINEDDDTNLITNDIPDINGDVYWPDEEMD